MLSIFFSYFHLPIFVFVFSKDFAIYPGALISAENFVFHANLLFVSNRKSGSDAVTEALRVAFRIQELLSSHDYLV